MYNDQLKVANKIISYDDLYEIFSKMNEKLNHYQKIYNNETVQNRMLDYSYQKWSFKDNGSKLSFNVDFYDNTSVRFDNYNNFITIFNNRLEDIKSIYVSFGLSYSVSNEEKRNEFYNQHIYMYIYESKIDIDVSLSSGDDKISDVYELIKHKIMNAPAKYDDVIKKKSSISTTVGLAISFIPAIIILSLLLIIPSIRYIFATSYVLYPICCALLALIIGSFVSSFILGDLYENIVPEQKYAGYDANKGKSIYKDDIDKYIETSEILIGKNVNNQKNRKEIMDIYNQYKKYIPYEIGVMILISIIVLFLK